MATPAAKRLGRIRGGPGRRRPARRGGRGQPAVALRGQWGGVHVGSPAFGAETSGRTSGGDRKRAGIGELELRAPPGAVTTCDADGIDQPRLRGLMDGPHERAALTGLEIGRLEREEVGRNLRSPPSRRVAMWWGPVLIVTALVSPATCGRCAARAHRPSSFDLAAGRHQRAWIARAPAPAMVPVVGPRSGRSGEVLAWAAPGLHSD